jgi:glycosyltransferase involved in cell wall biosynthesis
MKFIFITREGYSNPGARIRCYGFARYLQAHGLDSEVFSFADCLGAKAGGQDYGFKLGEKIKYDIKAYRNFFRKKENITDCVYILNRLNYHSLPVLLNAATYKVPLIFDVDDWEAQEDISYYFNFMPRSGAEYLMRLAARGSDFCIAASFFLKEYLSQFNSQVYYLPTAVDTAKFKFYQPGNKRKNFTFSWHGSINRPELVEYLKFVLDCFQILRKDYQDIKFVIRAKGKFAAGLKEFVQNNYPGVIFMQWVDSQQMPRYLKEVDVGVVPLLDNTRFNLAKSPVKVFEYMASGKPVIASGTGEARSIINHGDNGLLAFNQKDFIKNMELLLTDKRVYATIAHQGRQTILRQYSMAVIGDKFLELLRYFYG